MAWGLGALGARLGSRAARSWVLGRGCCAAPLPARAGSPGPRSAAGAEVFPSDVDTWRLDLEVLQGKRRHRWRLKRYPEEFKADAVAFCQ